MKSLSFMGLLGLMPSLAFGGARSKSNQRPAFLGECTNFSGVWVGMCYQDGWSRDEQQTMTIEQQDCEQFKRDNVIYDFDQIPATTGTMVWNKDKTVLTSNDLIKDLLDLPVSAEGVGEDASLFNTSIIETYKILNGKLLTTTASKDPAPTSKQEFKSKSPNRMICIYEKQE